MEVNMLQSITGHARRAIDDYNMIEDGDKIAIGLSGGKDSLALLYSLSTLKRYYPKKFDLIAITIHPGSDTFQTDKYKSNYFNKYSVSSFVTQASFILSEYLAKYGVGSVVEEESVAKIRKEEDIAYTYSYRASRILLERKKEDIPSLNYYFDNLYLFIFYKIISISNRRLLAYPHHIRQCIFCDFQVFY